MGIEPDPLFPNPSKNSRRCRGVLNVNVGLFTWQLFPLATEGTEDTEKKKKFLLFGLTKKIKHLTIVVREINGIKKEMCTDKRAINRGKRLS
jgi:hypothetical protein